MKAESFISDKAYQHSCIFRTVIFVVGVGGALENQEFLFYFDQSPLQKFWALVL